MTSGGWPARLAEAWVIVATLAYFLLVGALYP
jgi:hypothetical protein